MSDGVKVQGLDELARLRGRKATWQPPASLGEFLGLVAGVITSSKYTDGFLRGSPPLEDLRALVRVKANRVALHPDVEECVDVAAYAYMVYHLLLERAKGGGK